MCKTTGDSPSEIKLSIWSDYKITNRPFYQKVCDLSEMARNPKESFFSKFQKSLVI